MQCTQPPEHISPAAEAHLWRRKEDWLAPDSRKGHRATYTSATLLPKAKAATPAEIENFCSKQRSRAWSRCSDRVPALSLPCMRFHGILAELAQSSEISKFVSVIKRFANSATSTCFQLPWSLSLMTLAEQPDKLKSGQRTHFLVPRHGQQLIPLPLCTRVCHPQRKRVQRALSALQHPKAIVTWLAQGQRSVFILSSCSRPSLLRKPQSAVRCSEEEIRRSFVCVSQET